MKPKLCELLGVEVNEEFVVNYMFYKVRDNGALYRLNKLDEDWFMTYIPSEWAINPQKYIRRFR